MKKLIFLAVLFAGSAQAHMFTPLECSAGANIFNEIATGRDQGISKDKADQAMDGVVKNTQGTDHVIDNDDAVMFHEGIKLIFSHPEITPNQITLQFYNECMKAWEAQHPEHPPTHPDGALH